MWFVPNKPAPPATVPTDQIIPVHYWDDQDYARAICLDVIFRFDDVLDAERLRSALGRLLEIGDWRKLGARLRKNEKGKLEYHVPIEFDEKRPAFHYTFVKYDTKVAEHHPIASRLPQATGRPSLFGSSDDLKPFVRSPNMPDRLDKWLSSDIPQLGIHIIAFEDATLVTVTFLHTLMDAMGLATLFKGWVAVLRGQEDEVPPFVGFDHDPLEGLTKTSPPQPHVLAGKLLKGAGFLIFVFWYIFERLWHRIEDERVIFLPAKNLQLMRDNAMEELASQETGDTTPFVSESDVLLSWWTRVLLRAYKPAPSTSITVWNVFDCRSILAELGHIPSSGAALFGNAVFPAMTFLSARQVFEDPLSSIASQIRKSLVQQRNQGQLQASAVLQKDMIDNAGHPPVFGDPGMLMFVCTNWARARFFEVDFSSAVLAPGIPVSQRANQLGRPSYVTVTGTKNGYSTRNAGPVIGKDAAGNWWMAYTLRREMWADIERQLGLMSEEDIK